MTVEQISRAILHALLAHEHSAGEMTLGECVKIACKAQGLHPKMRHLIRWALMHDTNEVERWALGIGD